MIGVGALTLVMQSGLELVGAVETRGQGSGRVPIAMFYHPPADGISARRLAQRTEAVVLTRGDEAYRDQLRRAGFEGPALQYLIAKESSGPLGLRGASDACGWYRFYYSTVSGISGDFCSALHPMEGNFLHNGRGERLYFTQSFAIPGGARTVALYLMNPAAPGWREYFASRAEVILKEFGYDGLMLDNVGLSLYQPRVQAANSDGVVAEFELEEDYREAVRGFLESVRAKLGQARIWANLISSSDSPTDWDAYLPFLNGVMNEYFVTRWRGTVVSPTVWEVQLGQAERVLSEGRGLLAVAQGQRDDMARLRFALASFLLIARPGAYFRYAHQDAYEQLWLYDDYEIRLGQPRGARYADGAFWRRDFECGQVAVDPAGQLGSISAIPRSRWESLALGC